MKSTCCNATLADLGYEDGAREALCDTCGEDLCSACAAEYSAEDGYGDDGQGVRTEATCKACAVRGLRLGASYGQRNDSGV